MPLQILRNDITHMETDAIVNAANSGLRQGGGVCGAIFAAAGAGELQAACDSIGFCPVGQAVITPAFRLPAKHIIHAVGPIWQGGGHGEEGLLRACYRNALALARSHGCASIAFPLISSGIYGYPKDQALSVAISAIGEFLLAGEEMQVSLVVFDKGAYRLSDQLFSDISSYIDDGYAAERLQAPRRPEYQAQLASMKRMERVSWEKHPEPKAQETPLSQLLKPRRRKKESAPPIPMADACMSAPGLWSDGAIDLSRLEIHPDESFSQRVLRLIDEKHKTDVEVYKRANLDRKLFSKIRSDPNYRPSRATAIALAIALELDLPQTDELLKYAGFALSPSSKFDLIVTYFITRKNYNIFEINEALFAFDQSLLGA